MKDRTELGNPERFIIKKVESLYDEWQVFTQYINGENNDLQKNKDSVIQEMHDSDDDLDNMEEELVQKMEFLMYGFQIKAKDQKTMLEVLLTFYSLSTELGLDEYFLQDLNKVLSELKEQRTKTVFIVSNNKVVEREKGAQREAVNKILKSDHYKEYKERLLSTMEK
jgi:hypothetical protein